MARLGAVSQRYVRASEKEDIDLEGGNGSKDGATKHKYGVPLSQLSVSAKPSTAAELNLKRPTMDMAYSMVRALLPYYWAKNSLSLKIRVIVSVSIIFFSKGVNLYVPLLFKNIINSLPNSVPVKLVLFYGFLTLLQKSIWDIRDIIFQDVSDGATRNVSVETFEHLHNLSLSYHLQKRTGALIKIVEKGTNSIVTLLSLLLFNIFPTLLELFTVTTFLLFSYGTTFAMINLFSCFLYVLFTVSITEWRNKYRRMANRKENEASDIRMDSLTNFETIKYFTSEQYEASRYNTSLLEYFKINMRARFSYFILNVGQSAIITMCATIGLLFTTYSASLGGFTVGDVIAINTYIAQMFQPLSWLGTSYRMILQSFADMEQLIELLNTKPEVADSPTATPLYCGVDQLPLIEFENISFKYKQGTTRLLENVSFKVPPGKSVAIVGPTGGGKSTLFRLLCRFYDVESGSIKINGTDIRDVKQTSLRSMIGVVPQDTVLFNDTIAFNIGFGKRECSDDELIDAATRAQIINFINDSPDGFATIVGERGLRLSGGEKQRVSIARALLKNPPILILDEATSALDSKTEKKIQQSLNEISKGRTTLIIAHRLSTVIHCDEILVLKEGTIVERGSHSKLLEMGGEYSSLWYQQLEHPDNASIPNQE